MNEKLEKLVDLKVALKLAEEQYESETDETALTDLEAQIVALKDEITALEAEMNTEEVIEEPAQEEVEENAEEDENQETVEEPVEEEAVEEEVTEETVEEEVEEEELTEEEVRSSDDWIKVDTRNLEHIASYGQEKRGGQKMEEKNIKALETRAKDLIEGRTVTVASSNILLAKHESDELATVPFRQFSSLVDMVKTRNLPGGESYLAPFTKSHGMGGVTEEGADYTDAEPEFGTVEINKVKITAYAEITEELEKLPAADYVSEVEDAVNNAVKKVIAKEIITGDATNNHFVGIFSTNEANKCVLESDDLEISAIGEDTLNEILFNYGGDEEVEAPAVLMLNKLDLLAFSKVRNATNGLKEYTIDYANQTINGIPYIINSNIKSLSAASAGDYVMAYGIPAYYEMPVFSDIETKKSYDYQFKAGKIAFRASVFTGGNTSSYRGFIRVKAKAAA